jgi:hypothetical protein
MRNQIAGALLGAFAAGCVPATHWAGPLPVRNQHPAQLTVAHLPPGRAAVLGAGTADLRVDAAYSSLFLAGQRGSRRWRMDGEYLRVGTTARVGLGHDLQFGIEVPFAHTSGGFLDDFVIRYHDWFGFPDQGREAAPRDDFQVAATNGTSPVWTLQRDSAELLDVPLQVQWAVLPPEPGRLGVALLAALELPTGDARRGYGSGGVDAAFGIAFELPWERLACYGQIQHAFAATPAAVRAAGLSFADVTAASVGLETMLLPELSLLVQVAGETSTLRDFDVPETAREQLLLWVGGRWRAAPRIAFELAFGEDLIGLASPDFTAWAGMVFDLGPGPPAPLPR